MYLAVMHKKDHPLHNALQHTKGNRIKRGKSWMAEAEDSLRKVCNPEDLCLGSEWIKVSSESDNLIKVVITMGRERREFADAVNECDIQSIIWECSRPGDPIIYTDGSVRLALRHSAWGFVAYINNKITHSDSGAFEVTTCSMKMEIEAISNALAWIATDCPSTTNAVIVTDSMSTLRRIEKGFVRAEWAESIDNSALTSLTWVFCPGHAGVRGNEEADRLAGEATVTVSQIQMDKSEALTNVSRMLRKEEEEEADLKEAVVRMKEIGVLRGDGRASSLGGNLRRRRNQALTGTISMNTLRAILQRGTEHIWTCPECDDVDS